MDGDSIDNDPTDPGNPTLGGRGGGFHGTHVAGTIAALSNNSLGVAGVAPGVRIMPVRVLGASGGTSFDLQQGVLYAAGLNNSSGTLPAQRADIINLSLAGPAPSQSEHNTFARARAQGVIVVAAAGNEGTDQPRYPAAYSGVISVSAVSINKTLASYSNFGSTIDIAAPGGDLSAGTALDPPQSIVSTIGRQDTNTNTFSINPTYAGSIGTSMAAPHVAGVLALMKSVRPQLTPAEVDAFLAAGRLTTDLGNPGLDDSFGQGLIDAHKAMLTAAITVSPTANKLSIVLANSGTQTLEPATIEVSAKWLSVTAPKSSDGLGYYSLWVNRDGLAPGTYTATVRFISGGQSTTVPVTLKITPSGAKRDSTLGPQSVFLTHAATRQTVRVVATQAFNGTYRYEFFDVAPGIYDLFSGNDLNNDGAVCGLGESCGAYLSMTQPSTLIVGGNSIVQSFDANFMTLASTLPTMITEANSHFASSPREPQSP
jgi:serine protease